MLETDREKLVLATPRQARALPAATEDPIARTAQHRRAALRRTTADELRASHGGADSQGLDAVIAMASRGQHARVLCRVQSIMNATTGQVRRRHAQVG